MKQEFSIFKKYVNVSCETLEKLVIYYEFKFLQKNEFSYYALFQDAEIRHFLDSAQLYTYCKNINGNIIDFGSGAGFPGAVLLILGASKVFLVDSSEKMYFINIKKRNK